MLYTLLHNNVIEVGPREYNKTFFDEYLQDNDIPTTNVPNHWVSKEPITITEDITIVPTLSPTIPSYNTLTEQLTGPHWDTKVIPMTGYYGVATRDIEAVRQDAIAIVKSNRYTLENSGTTVTINTETLSVLTDRDTRGVWAITYAAMDDLSTQNFKFSKENKWVALTKVDVKTVIDAINTHVQSAFDWESTMTDKINQSDIVTLSTLNLNYEAK